MVAVRIGPLQSKGTEREHDPRGGDESKLPNLPRSADIGIPQENELARGRSMRLLAGCDGGGSPSRVVAGGADR